MSIFEIKFKHRFLYNIAIFVLLSHFFLFFIFSFLNKPLKIAFLVNKSAVNLSFKVDYTQKRTAKKIDSDKLKTKNLKSTKPKLTKIEKPIIKENIKEKITEKKIINNIIKAIEKPIEKPKLAKIEKPITKEVTKEVIKEKLKEEKVIKEVLKNIIKPIVKPKLAKIEKPITKEVLKEKLKQEIKEEIKKESIKEDFIEEELIIGRQELEELKLTLQMHDKVQSFWKPPQGLKPNKASKWSLTIEKNGKRKVEKIESSGILAFDMAAQRSLMLVDIKITVPVLILEVAFTG